MAFPFIPTFLVLLVLYMGYSEWARLDSRYLIGAALLLLVVTALVDASGATGAADTLAEYVFLLLAGGVVLLLVDQVRERPRRDRGRPSRSGLRTGDSDAPDATQERQGSTHQSLEGPE